MTPLSLQLNDINIGNAHGFAPGQVLHIGPGLTIIEGCNGSGKTRLANVIKDHVRDILATTDNCMIEAWLSLIYVDEMTVLHLGEESPVLRRVLGEGVEAASTTARVSAMATQIWREARGSYDPRCARVIINIGDRGVVSMEAVVGRRSMDESFYGFVDRCLVDMAIRLAILKIRNLLLPLVIDGLLDHLSSSSANQLIKMLSLHSSQCVVMKNPISELNAGATRLTLVLSNAGVLPLPLPLPLSLPR